MKIYEIASRFIIMAGREGELPFGGRTIRILCDAKRKPEEYIVAIDDELLIDTSGTPAVYLDRMDAVEWGKAHAKALSLGRTPPVPEAPEQEVRRERRPRMPRRRGRR